MLTRYFSGALLALVLAALAKGESNASWSGPVLGHVFDSTSRELRVLTGLPGAASYDNPVALPSKLRAAWTSPADNYAIVAGAEGSGVSLVRGGPEPKLTHLQGTPSSVASVSFSASGKFAAIYSSESSTLQVWSGFPDAPALVREFAAQPLAIVLSDDGSFVGALLSDGLYSLTSDGPALLRSGVFRAAALAPGASHVALIEEGSESLVLVTPSGEATTLHVGPAAASKDAALAYTADGSRLLLASPAARSVTVAALDGTSTNSLSCDCNALMLTPLQRGSVFRLTDGSGDLTHFLDMSSNEPSIFFVSNGGGR